MSTSAPSGHESPSSQPQSTPSLADRSAGLRHCRIVDGQPLSVDQLLDAVRDPSVGGVAVFIGVVRDFDEGQSVTSLSYSKHPSAGEQLRECALRVLENHEVVSVAVEHRVGHLEVGDFAVVVAVGAVHRGEAIAACKELIDDLKHAVPIWKEQQFTSGDTAWVGLG